ncbi:MAG: Gfo/Idh/MocA family protein [Rhodanobacter sp.]
MRVVVVGTGFAAQHLRWISASPNLRVAALCFANGRTRAESLAQEFGVPTVSDDVERTLDQESVDGVVIVTPPHTHEVLVMAAVARGLLVVCDKPLSASLASAKRLAEATRGYGPGAYVMFQWRLHPAFTRAVHAVETGSIGSVLHVSLRFTHDFLAFRETSFPWRHSYAHGGAGALGDMGVHLFDLLRCIKPGTWLPTSASGGVAHPERIYAGTELPGATEDFSDVLLVDRDSGCKAVVSVSRVAQGLREIRMVVVGSSGTITLRLDPEDASGQLVAFEAGGSEREERFEPGSLNPYHAISSACDAAAGASSNAPTFQDGLLAQELLEAAVHKLGQ